MKLIISPAKKMNLREDELEISGMPPFMEQTGQILQYMRGLTRGEAQKLWKCNDSIADLNYERFYIWT